MVDCELLVRTQQLAENLGLPLEEVRCPRSFSSVCTGASCLWADDLGLPFDELGFIDPNFSITGGARVDRFFIGLEKTARMNGWVR